MLLIFFLALRTCSTMSDSISRKRKRCSRGRKSERCYGHFCPSAGDGEATERTEHSPVGKDTGFTYLYYLPHQLG